MSESFDPYHKWLGIRPKDQPPNHYRLLGVELFETDSEVIDAAANARMAYLQSLACGPHADQSQKLLNELAAARLCLLTSEKKTAYDAELKRRLTRATRKRARTAVRRKQPADVPLAPAALTVAAPPAAPPAPPPAPPPAVTSAVAPGLPLSPSARLRSRRGHPSQTAWLLMAGLVVAVAAFIGGIFYVLSQQADRRNSPDPYAATAPWKEEQRATEPLRKADAGRRTASAKPAPPDEDHGAGGSSPDSDDHSLIPEFRADEPFEPGGPVESDRASESPDRPPPPRDRPFAFDDRPPPRENPEKIARRQKEAIELFEKALAAIDKKQIHEAIELLLECINDLPGPKQVRASQLLEQSRIAIDDQYALSVLMNQFSDEALKKFEQGRLRLQFTEPFVRRALEEVFYDTLRRNLPEAKRRRAASRGRD